MLLATKTMVRSFFSKIAAEVSAGQDTCISRDQTNLTTCFATSLCPDQIYITDPSPYFYHPPPSYIFVSEVQRP